MEKTKSFLKQTIFILDDNFFYREGIKNSILNYHSDFEVIGDSSDTFLFIQFIEIEVPHILILDYTIYNNVGLDLFVKLLLKYPQIKVIITANQIDDKTLDELGNMGIKGFIHRNADISELIQCIDILQKGNYYYSGEIISNNESNSIMNTNKSQNNNIILTKRESEILKMICNGLSNIEIGEKLFISQRTVDGHRAKLLKKTNSKNTALLVIWAINNNIYFIK